MGFFRVTGIFAVGLFIGYALTLLINDKPSAIEARSVMIELSNLEQKYQKLEKQLRQSQYKVLSLNRKIEGPDESDITNEQLSGLVPENYESLVFETYGKVRDKILNFHSHPENSVNNDELSNRISSFIVNHSYSGGVELNSIICKESYCEILINEFERPSWHNIWHDLTKQDWWKSSNASIGGDFLSTSKHNEDGNIYIYYFLRFKS